MKETGLFLVCTVLSAAAFSASASAQPRAAEKQRYVKFKIDPDFETALKNRLKMEQQLGPFKDLIKQIMDDPSKMPTNPDQLKNLNLQSDEFKKALKDWAANDPVLRKALEDLAAKKADGAPAKDVEKIQAQVKQFLKDNPPPEPEVPPEPQKQTPEAVKPETVSQATERLMKQTETTKLGDWLRDSPAWNRAFQDIRTSINNPDSPSWNLEDLKKKFQMPEGKLGQLGEGALDRLRGLRPDMKRWGATMPRFDNLAAPNVGGPGLPNLRTPAMPSLSGAALWILLALLVLLVGTFFWRGGKKTTPLAEQRARMGPWPVRPEAVATRAELVQAFDYLALWTLGLEVRSWNHRAVAFRWREQAPACADPAQALASLYEQARYTVGADLLGEPERDLARLSLAQIAEAM